MHEKYSPEYLDTIMMDPAVRGIIASQRQEIARLKAENEMLRTQTVPESVEPKKRGKRA